MKLFSNIIFSIVLLSSSTFLVATKTYVSDAGTGGFTFNFNANKAVISSIDPGYPTFYAARTAATTADATEAPFAIAGCKEYGTTFADLTPESVTYNMRPNSTNPLYGQQISLLNVYRGTPLVVRADDPTLLYWMSSAIEAPTVSMYGTLTPLKDAQGAVGDDGQTTAGIVQIGAGSYLYAAVKANAGDFGDVGSGIAVAYIGSDCVTQAPAVPGDTGVKAAPLDVTSDTIAITSDAAALSNTIIDVYWSDGLSRLYVTFEATAGGGATDGVRSVVVGYVNNGTITFYPFAPDTAFVGTDYIVGGVGAATVTTIHKFRTMFTSTSVHYGIVLGNAHDAATSLRTVYALPLVNKVVAGNPLSDPEQGVLASKTVAAGINLQSFYNNVNQVNYFTARGFQVPAATTADLTSRTDRAAIVGGGVVPGDVTDIMSYKDAVFVSVGDGATTQQAGIFYSQALFDEYGAIKAWTPWQRCYTSNNAGYGVFAFGYQGKCGQFFTAEGVDNTVVKTYKTTVFNNSDADGILGGTTGDASVGLISQVESIFDAVPDGVQMVNLFPSNHAGLSQTTNQKLSLMAFSGYNQLLLAQTGSQAGGVFSPSVGDFSAGKRTFTAGAISTAPAANTELIAISGGALETIGSINSTTIINDGNYGYLVVGGVGGVAVLKNVAGQGWPTAGLQKNFSNIGTDKYFQLIGSYQNVRKVWADGTNLYVLTAQQLDRIPAGQLANANPTAFTIATPEALQMPEYASFSDIITSGKLGLLATSVGLYRSANSTDITSSSAASASAWTRIPLTDAPVAVTRLYPLSQTGLGYDFANRAGGGNVYVLAASVAQGLSATYRFSIADTSASLLNSTTVQPFQDYIIQNLNSGFIQWGNYRNYVTTDGSRTYAQRAAYLGQLPLVEDASYTTAGKPFIQREHNTFPFTFTGYSALAPLVRAETGSLVVAGNNGLQVLE